GMSTPKPHSTVASRTSGIRPDWLTKTSEAILEPDLPIVDPHHHLWDFPAHRYLLPDLLADTGSGHKHESTVFIECTACYRADGRGGNPGSAQARPPRRGAPPMAPPASPWASSAWST